MKNLECKKWWIALKCWERLILFEKPVAFCTVTTNIMLTNQFCTGVRDLGMALERFCYVNVYKRFPAYVTNVNQISSYQCDTITTRIIISLILLYMLSGICNFWYCSLGLARKLAEFIWKVNARVVVRW